MYFTRGYWILKEAFALFRYQKCIFGFFCFFIGLLVIFQLLKAKINFVLVKRDHYLLRLCKKHIGDLNVSSAMFTVLC